MLREFLKGVVVLTVVVAFLTAAIAWGVDRPDELTWWLRIGAPIVAIAAFGAFLQIHFQRDEVPDFLYQSHGGYFDRGGFCFAIGVHDVGGVCHVEVYFQNRYDRPCIGRIALRPKAGFFGRQKIDTIALEIPCEPAAFGVVSMPIPVPLAVQGKRQTFEVGASVKYPQGRGKMLRFRDGIVIRTNSNFGDAFGTTLAVGALLGGNILIPQPATVELELPRGVLELPPRELQPEVKSIWRLGDPVSQVKS